MIVVIADDLTGAAELAGIALRYGLRSEITTKTVTSTEADVLVIATDARSKNQSGAVHEMEEATRNVVSLEPSWIFKKIDSILRGHILAEINAQLPLLNLKRALLLPANPHLGRTIVDGTYYFHNNPIHLSSFSHDPEFAITSSNVTAMLRSSNTSVHVRKWDEIMPDNGVVIGDTQTEQDLKAWAAKVDLKTTFVGGGAGMFNALLEVYANKPPASISDAYPARHGPALLVCGSTFDKSREKVKAEADQGGPVSYMPEDIVKQDHPSEAQWTTWTEEVKRLLHSYRKAIIAIDPNTTTATSEAATLRMKTACVVKKVFGQISIHELLVEGGATASAILTKLQLSTFYPVEELAPGVIRMRVKDMQDVFLTLKPGSYDWPVNTWKFPHVT